MTTTEAEAEVLDMEAPAEIPELRVADRCDRARCGAQAFVMFGKPLDTPEGPRLFSLLFCAHDAREYELPLMSKGFEIVVDTRDSINAKPSPSANAG